MSSLHMTSMQIKKWLLVLLIAMLATVGIGCASGRYGRLHQNAEVTRMFRSNSVPDYYRYYFNGRTNLPYAIIGIDPRYRLDTQLWEPVAPNTDEFAQKVAFMWRPNIWEQWDPAEGAWIETPDGQKIGIWYSMYPYTTIRMEEENQLAIFSPFNPSRE